MSRRGCLGEIKNCYSDKTESIARSSNGCGTTFWKIFDSTDTGACVALQTLPFGVADPFGKKDLRRWDIGPVFAGCQSLHYLACEAEGRRSEHIDEKQLIV